MFETNGRDNFSLYKRWANRGYTLIVGSIVLLILTLILWNYKLLIMDILIFIIGVFFVGKANRYYTKLEVENNLTKEESKNLKNYIWLIENKEQYFYFISLCRNNNEIYEEIKKYEKIKKNRKEILELIGVIENKK